MGGGDLSRTDATGDVWRALSGWLAGRELGPVAAQARLLGLPAAQVPAGPVSSRRPPVLCSPGGPREPSLPGVPLVVDLTSLWPDRCARTCSAWPARGW